MSSNLYPVTSILEMLIATLESKGILTKDEIVDNLDESPYYNSKGGK